MVLDHARDFGAMLKIGLKAQGGYSADHFTTAAEALAAAAGGEYSLALVEYSLDGRQFLYGYKAVDPLLSVVILTALPTQETAVEFLRGGAAAMAIDYIIKPAPDLIRQLADIIDTHFARVAAGDWVVERKLRTVTYRGRPLALTPMETAVFTYFMLHPYETVRHEDLWLAARGEEVSHSAAVNKVRTVISRLRDKLEEVAGRDVIQSLREDGFRFRPEAVAAGLAGNKTLG
jgi:DNA-binding response OmpR family regulator